MPTTALRRIRRARFLTQTELGDALGVAQTTVSLWEAGARKPHASSLRALESYLGHERTVLLALEDEPVNDQEPPLRESDGLGTSESAESQRKGTTCNGDHPQDGNLTSEREAHCE